MNLTEKVAPTSSGKSAGEDISSLTRPLKVGHVTWGLDVGGQEKMLVELARHADRNRVALHFISLGGRGKLAENLEAQGWPVTALHEPAGLRLSLIWRLAWLFRKLRLDVVHTHDDRPLLYGSLAAKLVRVPMVIHTQHHGNLTSISRRQAFLIRLAGRLTDRFVCVSQDSTRHMIEEGVPPGKVTTLWNGIDLVRFPFQGFQPGGPLVTVARLSPEKGIETLLQAMPGVVRFQPRIHLEIAGDGPLRADLERRAAELGLRDKVRFLGEIRDIVGLLKRASLFVLPSYSEGISLTLLEAMACGLPVVTTKVGGNPEVVVDGQTGLLAPAGDPHALARCMVQLLEDNERRQLMGRAGRHRVEAHFDIRRVTAQYENFYQAR